MFAGALTPALRIEVDDDASPQSTAHFLSAALGARFGRWLTARQLAAHRALNRYSQNEVYVEVKGIFTNLHIQNDRLGEVRSHIESVRSFIDTAIYPYLSQFESAPESLS